MEIYLIRHTTPDVVVGTCYGQSDLDVTESFFEEAEAIRAHLPSNMASVYSSPLKRCHLLAQQLFPKHSLQLDDRLKEIHCGEWEMKIWNGIDPLILKPWMEDFVNNRFPGGENYVDLFNRTTRFFNELSHHPQPQAIVSHGGVLRSILCHLENTQLKDSFSRYGLRYGCVVKLTKDGDVWQHEVLHNPPAPKEQHKPTIV